MDQITLIHKKNQYKPGDHVDYFKRGICYPSIITADLGIQRGAGRKYRIVARDPDETGEWTKEVAERTIAPAF